MNYIAIGKRIRDLRIKQGFTQESIAEKASISLSFYGHIERGSRKMSLETLVSIATILQCSADYLLGNNSCAPSTYQQAPECIRHYIDEKLSALI